MFAKSKSRKTCVIIRSMRSQDTFQDPHLLKRLFRHRLMAITLLILLLTFILLVRLAYLQLWQHHYYKTLSTNNSINLVPIAPPRGLIYDRNGVLLAENTPVYNLTVIPDQVPDLQQTITDLQNIVNLTPQDIKAFNRELNQKRAYDEIPLKVKLTPEQVAQFMVNRYRFPGVHVSAALSRSYPFANDMVSVLGYVGRINVNDMKNLDLSNYAATNYIGKIGIEKYFENQLHGQVGYQQVETDASGQAVRILNRTPPVQGENIYLTIDSKLQEAALRALQGYVGAVVAIQPSTGQVLALASTPAYDPNIFVAGISNEDYQALRNASDQPLYNRAIRGQFPFGSTIKVFLALGALAGGYTTPDFQIYDPGYVKLGDHIFHDEVKNTWVNLIKAISMSSDTYFYRLSLKMGIDAMDDILQKFGFGQYTHIQMYEELPGLVASPAWKLKTTGKSWYAGDTLNSSIGQGAMLTTPLQLASAVATIAERGIRYQPTLLYKMVGADHTVIQPIPIALMPITLKPDIWDTVIEGMVQVIRGEHGTGWRFGKPSYSVAAKTGTAQVYSLKGQKYVVANVPQHLRDNSMFIAFAPVENPQIAVAVTVQNASMASAVARKIMDYYLLQENQSELPTIALPTVTNLGATHEAT